GLQEEPWSARYEPEAAPRLCSDAQAALTETQNQSPAPVRGPVKREQMNTNTIALVTNVTQGNVSAESAFPAVTSGSTRAVVGWPAYVELDPTSSAPTSLPASVVDGHP